MHLATFRHPNHFFGNSTPFRLGQFDDLIPDLELPEPPPPLEPEPEPEPPPPPPPVTTCKPIGKPFFEDRICYQVFECKTNGTITYEKRPSADCPHPGPRNIYYPYPYLFPVTTAYQPTRTELVIEDEVEKKTSLKDVAPYAIGTIAAAALLYAIFK